MLRAVMVNFAISCALLMAAQAQNPGSALQPQSGAQQISNPSSASATAAATPAAVGLDQPVITLKGGCQPVGNVQPAKNCVQTVTREQFEKLIASLQPDMPVEARRSFAVNYGRLLVFFDAAQALHLEDNPAMQQILQFVTKQVMADGIKRHYAEQFAHPSEEQVQTYYEENNAKYVEVNLDRIIVPRKPASEEQPTTADAVDAASAEKLRQRWVAGEDPASLQKAAYESAGITGAGSPEVSLGARLPGSLPVNQESVFHLKAGEVSQVYSDPAAFYIYKVTSVREIPLSEVKDSIVKTLQQQQLQDKLEEISKSAVPELNDQYFGPAPPTGATTTVGHPVPPVRPGQTPPK